MSNYAIRREPSNCKEVNTFFSELYNRLYTATGRYVQFQTGRYIAQNHEYDYLLYPRVNKINAVSINIPQGYTEISLDQLKAHLNGEHIEEEVMYEIY